MVKDNPPWQPSCSLAQLKARAELYAQIRAFFMARDVLEVETPQVSVAGATDPLLASVPVSLRKDLPDIPSTYYLQTSPEFAMKRLLAAGSGPIYQICKTFRDGESGKRHNPEFTMLEWYRPGFDLEALMTEVADLVQTTCGVSEISSITYEDAFLHYLDIDPFGISEQDLASKAQRIANYDGPLLARDDYLNMLLGMVIEPELGKSGPCFLTEYPASQASLAQTKLNARGYLVAERFELYINGLEIANGYFELTDPQEQRRRFESDNHARKEMALPEIPLDENLLAALEYGMPSCAGVALGLDRLLMIQQEVDRIDAVLSFPIERA